MSTNMGGVATIIQRSKLFQNWVTKQAQLPQFTWEQAYYVYEAKTPAQCRRCPWFVLNEADPTQSSCVIVAAPINANGVCGLFNATPGRIAFFERMYGRGAGNLGRLPGVLRGKVEQKRWNLGNYKLVVSATGLVDLVNDTNCKTCQQRTDVTISVSAQGGSPPYSYTAVYADGTKHQSPSPLEGAWQDQYSMCCAGTSTKVLCYATDAQDRVGEYVLNLNVPQVELMTALLDETQKIVGANSWNDIPSVAQTWVTDFDGIQSQGITACEDITGNVQNFDSLFMKLTSYLTSFGLEYSDFQSKYSTLVTWINNYVTGDALGKLGYPNGSGGTAIPDIQYLIGNNDATSFGSLYWLLNQLNNLNLGSGTFAEYYYNIIVPWILFLQQSVTYNNVSKPLWEWLNDGNTCIVIECSWPLGKIGPFSGYPSIPSSFLSVPTLDSNHTPALLTNHFGALNDQFNGDVVNNNEGQGVYGDLISSPGNPSTPGFGPSVPDFSTLLKEVESGDIYQFIKNWQGVKP